MDSVPLSVSLLPPISANFEDYQFYCTFLSLSLTPDVADIQELQVRIVKGDLFFHSATSQVYLLVCWLGSWVKLMPVSTFRYTLGN